MSLVIPQGFNKVNDTGAVSSVVSHSTAYLRSVYGSNLGYAGDLFLQLFDLTRKPANGDVPFFVMPLTDTYSEVVLPFVYPVSPGSSPATAYYLSSGSIGLAVSTKGSVLALALDAKCHVGVLIV